MDLNLNNCSDKSSMFIDDTGKGHVTRVMHINGLYCGTYYWNAGAWVRVHENLNLGIMVLF